MSVQFWESLEHQLVALLNFHFVLCFLITVHGATSSAELKNKNCSKIVCCVVAPLLIYYLLTLCAAGLFFWEVYFLRNDLKIKSTWRSLNFVSVEIKPVTVLLVWVLFSFLVESNLAVSSLVQKIHFSQELKAKEWRREIKFCLS